MVKKIIFLINFLLLIYFSHAQEIERITFQELRADGRYLRDITVNAIHIGWQQQNLSLEGNFQITYDTSNIFDQGWTEWRLAQRSPALITNIGELYRATLQAFSDYPRAGRIALVDGFEIIRMFSTPNRRTSPIWWAEDGKSFNVFFSLYAIVPN